MAQKRVFKEIIYEYTGDENSSEEDEEEVFHEEKEQIDAEKPKSPDSKSPDSPDLKDLLKQMNNKLDKIDTIETKVMNIDNTQSEILKNLLGLNKRMDELENKSKTDDIRHETRHNQIMDKFEAIDTRVSNIETNRPQGSSTGTA